MTNSLSRSDPKADALTQGIGVMVLILLATLAVFFFTGSNGFTDTAFATRAAIANAPLASSTLVAQPTGTQSLVAGGSDWAYAGSAYTLSALANRGADVWTAEHNTDSSAITVKRLSGTSGALLGSTLIPAPPAPGSYDVDILPIRIVAASDADAAYLWYKAIIYTISGNSSRYILARFTSSTLAQGPAWVREDTHIYPQYGIFANEQTGNNILVTRDDSRMVAMLATRNSAPNIWVFNTPTSNIPTYQVENDHLDFPGIQQSTVSYPSLSRDGSTLVGRFIYPGSNENKVGAFRLDQGTPPVATTFNTGTFYPGVPAVSEDGTFIAEHRFNSATRVSSLAVFRRQDGTPNQYTFFPPYFQTTVETIPADATKVNDFRGIQFGPGNKLMLAYGIKRTNPTRTSTRVFQYTPTPTGFTQTQSYEEEFLSNASDSQTGHEVNDIHVADDASFVVGFKPFNGVLAPEMWKFQWGTATPIASLNFPGTTPTYQNETLLEVNPVSDAYSLDGAQSIYQFYPATLASTPQLAMGNWNSIPAFGASDGLFADRVRNSWASIPGATGYEVFRSPTLDFFSATLLTPSPITTLSYGDYSAVPGTVYYYWVRARNGAAAFQPALDRGYRAPLPVTPSNLTASRNFTDRIELEWTYPSGEGYAFFPHALFNVFRSAGATPVVTSGTPYASGITARSFTDTGTLVAGERYHYRVVAVNAAGTSAPSNVGTGWKKILPATGTYAGCDPGDVTNTDGSCTKTIVGASLDGEVSNFGSSWATVRDATTGSPSTTGFSLFESSFTNSPTNFSATRAYFTFSFPPLTAVTLTSVSFIPTVALNTNFPADGTGSIRVVPWNPLFQNSLNGNDWSRVSLNSATQYASVSMDALPVSATPLSIPFNASGVNYVSQRATIGTVNFGVVEGHHMDLNPYAYASGNHSSVINATESALAERPRLVINYHR